jgi:signal transduction histidine kinase
MLIAHLTKGRITVTREYGRLPLVDCHPNQLNQVFLNLLVNASQAIAGDGEVVIRTRLGDGAREVVVEIIDDGSGIPPEHLSRIFDPGFTTKGVGVGTGLGLSICYRIVQEHGGRIEVESTPGHGSTFRVMVPSGAAA